MTRLNKPQWFYLVSFIWTALNCLVWMFVGMAVDKALDTNVFTIVMLAWPAFFVLYPSVLNTLRIEKLEKKLAALRKEHAGSD